MTPAYKLSFLRLQHVVSTCCYRCAERLRRRHLGPGPHQHAAGGLGVRLQHGGRAGRLHPYRVHPRPGACVLPGPKGQANKGPVVASCQPAGRNPDPLPNPRLALPPLHHTVPLAHSPMEPLPHRTAPPGSWSPPRPGPPPSSAAPCCSTPPCAACSIPGPRSAGEPWSTCESPPYGNPCLAPRNTLV